jgi:hypothetical protein
VTAPQSGLISRIATQVGERDRLATRVQEQEQEQEQDDQDTELLRRQGGLEEPRTDRLFDALGGRA